MPHSKARIVKAEIEGLVVWTVAKILGNIPTMPNREAADEWIQKRGKKEKGTYLAVPFFIPHFVPDKSAPRRPARKATKKK